ncbi:hypothetical protein A1704_03605 [Chryseobacterium cucumeris]|uniref:DUF4249 domain-containing protein n=1 Tax=Chryseobacterium TaxID=59732 RepID=UPI00078825FB|nr:MULTISPECIES: DUF4249 domain-containing protein [Chryseobacterium]KYH07762.1 hypothetical protein A1704_03605 [Chryseobacterium cucumeris]QWT87397.1 DUF4249 domain-containing protein [Chryseobacterium sp. PCH239]RKE80901.1 uncharacterized protein DUF4249 [Chryseobacterium sp. AG363]TXJ00006.1 MAG: DUF4249 domain-containing protein [Chryseobacterium cucumeris]
MKNTLYIIVSLLALTSCEKEIDLDLNDQSGNIVIEGNVTNQSGPYTVKITKSVSFSSPNQYPAVTGAQVILSDNTGQTETLHYVGNGVYQTTTFAGEPGRTYTLKVESEGKQYSAQSKMPEVVNFDGLQQSSFKFGDKTTYTLLPLFTDPLPLGNRYLFSFTINDLTKKYMNTFSDNVNNGLPNQQPLILPNDDNKGRDHEVVVGDKIHVEMQSIDNNVFTYYSALLQISGGNGGTATPTNPPSNISNGALGYFSAHTTDTQTFVIEQMTTP